MSELWDPHTQGRGPGRPGGQGGLGAAAPLALTRGLFLLQLMMQYLYYGGTESMDIPTADVLEVRLSSGAGGELYPTTASPHSLHACLQPDSCAGLHPALGNSIWRGKGERWLP